MKIELSKLSKPELVELYKMFNTELKRLQHPHGFCEIDCQSCPHNNYCDTLSDSLYAITKEFSSRMD